MRSIWLLVVMLGGCAAINADAQREAALARFSDTCAMIGFAKGSDRHKDCVLDLVKQSMTAQTGATNANRAALNGAMGASIINGSR